ncbi:MAG: glycosyltransferase, partial [Schleiferiaceae bacterium]|nr:glycosyltransferase [Schleiferiaceae bacterium]
MKISGAVITFNEEENLDRCLNSLKDVCDEIVIIDSFSTDNTQ